jgi:Family of unknown function (DUF6599)
MVQTIQGVFLIKKPYFSLKYYFLSMTSLLILLSFMATITDTSMQEFLPQSIDQWNISEPVRFYSGNQIFHYMDGAGEVYLAYKFKDLLVQRYSSKDKSEILVEIFDMGSPKNAYGIYTYMQGRGPIVNIGQDGEYKSGLLCFWRNRYFVSIKIEEEEARIKSAVMEMGKYISERITSDVNRPTILKYLPKNIYIENSLRYFYRYEILNNHFYLAGENILKLTDSTECLLVRLKQDKSYLLLVQYPDTSLADSAYNNFIIHYMPDARETGAIKTENKKWTVSARHNNFIIIVFDADTKAKGTNSLDTIKRRLP